MTQPIVHDTPLIPWEQEASFIEGVATDESYDLGVDALLARAVGCDAAAAAAPPATASNAGAQRRRQRFLHQARVYRQLAADRRS